MLYGRTAAETSAVEVTVYVWVSLVPRPLPRKEPGNEANVWVGVMYLKQDGLIIFVALSLAFVCIQGSLQRL